MHKGLEENSGDLFERIILPFSWRDWGRLRITLNMISGILGKIRSLCYWNIIKQFYCYAYTSLLRGSYSRLLLYK